MIDLRCDDRNASDEVLCQQIAEGSDDAERVLIERYMQAIYWLPRKAFGADEDELGDFLVFAIEKIRDRDILRKYDETRGARFSTWFGVVLRNLYLDYVRARPNEPGAAAFIEEVIPSSQTPESKMEEELLGALRTRCRVVFKLLLCNTFLLDAEEMQWIAKESRRSLLETTERIAGLEMELGEKEAALQERYDQLAVACWWKTAYERQLQELDPAGADAYPETTEAVENTERKLLRRRQEYARLADELSGTAGIATAPYKRLAELLNMPEGTLASHISRCRSAAADFLRQRRAAESDARGTE